MQKCRGCGTEITWVKTAKGKSMPINAKPIKAYKAIQITRAYTDYELVEVYLPHWSSCPDAAKFKKNKKGGG